MLLFAAFILIVFLWFYGQRLRLELGQLRQLVSDQGLHLSDLDGRVKILEGSASTRLTGIPALRSAAAPPIEEHPLPPAPPSLPFAPPPVPPGLADSQPTPPFQEARAGRASEPAPSPELPASGDSIVERIRPSGGWEELIGGNLLNKLGALLLVIGIALFLSYSFAHMGPVGIASTAAALSAATLAGGTILERRERYRAFSRGLIAAGWAGLYFTSYAMYMFPAAKIIDSRVAGTSLMVLVAVGTVLHSLHYRVQSLTSLAYGCVFAALAISGQNTFVAIALVPLAASTLFLARRLRWFGTSLFGAAATYATFLTRPNENAPLLSIQAMLAIFWLMFEGFDLLRVNASLEEWPGTGALFALNTLAGVGASAAIWFRLAPDSMWQFCAAAAVLYLASAWIRFAMQGQTLYEFALMISAFLAGLAVFAGVRGLWISLGVMAEAEALFLGGRYLNLRFARDLSLIGFAVAVLQLATRIGSAPSIIWGISIDPWAPPLVAMALVFYLNRGLSKESRYFGFFASAFLAAVMGVEFPWRYAGAAVLLYGVLLMEIGIRRTLPDFRVQGYGLAALGAIGASLSFLDPLHVRNAWVYAFSALFSQILAIRGTRSLTSLPEQERRGLRMGGAIGAAALAAALATRLAPNTYWGIAMVGMSMILFELACAALPPGMLIPAFAVNVAGCMRLIVEHADGVMKNPEQTVLIAHAGAALAYYYLSARLLRNARPEARPIRIVAPYLGSAFALVTIWMLLPAAYVCVAFGALAILTTEAGHFSNAQHLIWDGRIVSLVAAVSLLGLAGQPGEVIVWNCAGVSAMQLLLLFRSRELRLASAHGYLASLILASALFNQVSGGMLTLSWSVEAIGLLVLGFAAQERTLRHSGLGMLLICIGKVFAYDLRNLETVYRILSFIGLGAILLLVSWIYTRFKEQVSRFL